MLMEPTILGMECTHNQILDIPIVLVSKTYGFRQSGRVHSLSFIFSHRLCIGPFPSI
jgi:hypothetical protein